MPRLNILRPHRRASSQDPAPVPQAPPPAAPATTQLALPPLDIGSPNLGSPGQWLTHQPPSPNPPPPSSATPASATTAPSMSFSRTSTPYTTLTTPPPLPAPTRPPSRPIVEEKPQKKLNRLNPISLLRRRSSQTQLLKGRLPDDFDPGIIYGTRHPDWTRGSGNEGRALSPVPVGKDGRVSVDLSRVSGLGGSPETAIKPPLSPVAPTQQPLETSEEATTVHHNEVEVPLPQEQEVYIQEPTESVMVKGHPVVVEDEDANEGELDVIGAAPEVEEGRPRGVTLVDHPLSLPHHALMNSSRFSFEGSSGPSPAVSVKERVERGVDYSGDEDDGFHFDLNDAGADEDDGFERANRDSGLDALEAAVKAMDLAQQGIGVAISYDAAIQHSQMVPSRPPIANPRELDLSDDSDLDLINDEKVSGLAGYEDEDDDDLYFDDGIITGEQPNYVSSTIPPPTVQHPTAETSPETEDNPDAEAEASIRASIQRASSGGALVPEDGSKASSSAPDPQAFPPFINPIGGGLGFTPQQSQFYAPSVNGTLLNGLALPSLTYALQHLQLQQQQQQQQQTGASSPYSDPDIDTPGFGYDDMDGYEDDDGMVAAANAEALASDSEGFYGSEFGFYPSSFNNGLGGFFGAAGGPELPRPPIRRPSLTPISERSESSYRNSMVFPVSWQTSAEEMTLGQLVHDEELTLLNEEYLMQLRHNAWGGSDTSLRSSRSFEDVAVGMGAQVGMMAPPPGLGTTPPPPPGLSHAGSRAMLPTKGSFEDPGTPPPPQAVVI